jgi:hypothetical protein
MHVEGISRNFIAAVMGSAVNKLEIVCFVLTDAVSYRNLPQIDVLAFLNARPGSSRA